VGAQDAAKPGGSGGEPVLDFVAGDQRGGPLKGERGITRWGERGRVGRWDVGGGSASAWML
jgi:hypothetical protein